MAITKDQIVSILYEVKDVSSGDVVDSNMNSTPLTFMIGRGQVIVGLENALSNMNNGESSDALVKAVDAYGEYDENATQTLPVEQFAGIELNVGMTLYGQDEAGQTVAVNVKSFDEKNVTIDFNHPLAGKDLLFSVHVTMVRNATAEELISGMPMENQQSFGGGSCSTGSCSTGTCSTGVEDDDPFGGSCATDGHGHGGGHCGSGTCHT
jgi:FKBP-type peptidyl-prolyl cis-trans isomerase SlyD